MADGVAARAQLRELAATRLTIPQRLEAEAVREIVLGEVAIGERVEGEQLRARRRRDERLAVVAVAAYVKRAASVGRGAMLPPIHEFKHEWLVMSSKVTFSRTDAYWCATCG